MTGIGHRPQDLPPGNPIPQDPCRDPMSLEQVAAMKKSVETSIDRFMESVGYKDPAANTDAEGWRHFTKGSAHGFCGVIYENNCLFFEAVAKVMDVPPDRESVEPLMRKLLELNLAMKNESKIGIKNNIIWIAIMKPVEYMEQHDIPRAINFTMSMADYIDDFLKQQYEGSPSEKKAFHRLLSRFGASGGQK